MVVTVDEKLLDYLEDYLWDTIHCDLADGLEGFVTDLMFLLVDRYPIRQLA